MLHITRERGLERKGLKMLNHEVEMAELKAEMGAAKAEKQNSYKIFCYLKLLLHLYINKIVK